MRSAFQFLYPTIWPANMCKVSIESDVNGSKPMLMVLIGSDDVGNLKSWRAEEWKAKCWEPVVQQSNLDSGYDLTFSPVLISN